MMPMADLYRQHHKGEQQEDLQHQSGYIEPVRDVEVMREC